jgi:hypothetical protein
VGRQPPTTPLPGEWLQHGNMNSAGI